MTSYRLALSPLFPATCRFYPTCSAYALKAYRLFGFWKGTWLAMRRVLRCHPFHPGGYDPLPPAVAPHGNCREGRRHRWK